MAWPAEIPTSDVAWQRALAPDPLAPHSAALAFANDAG